MREDRFTNTPDQAAEIEAMVAGIPTVGGDAVTARTKRLWRVTAYWPGHKATHRDYQSRVAAEHKAAALRAPTRPDGFNATSVTVTASDPITWPKP